MAGNSTQRGELPCLLLVLAATGILMGAVVTRVVAAERLAGAAAVARSKLTITDSVSMTLRPMAFCEP
jgi:hypothetical protein